MDEESPSDLLIFKNRPEPAVQKPEPQVETTPAQQPEQQPVQQAAPQPEPQATPVQSKPYTPPRSELLYVPTVKRNSSSDMMSGGLMSEAESLRLAKGKFCENHPWRHAYAVCNVCKLPYCFIDIMEEHGKLYCLNDIDKAMEASNQTANPSINSFSILSSIIFIINSFVLGYFMLPQATYLVQNAMSVGITKFIFSISNTYYIPIGNMLIAVLGIVAAITVMRRSFYGFGFSLLVSFIGLMLVLYEYLNTSVLYLFISSVLLLLSLASLTYSRMSSAKKVAEEVMAPEIEWPKPETF